MRRIQANSCVIHRASVGGKDECTDSEVRLVEGRDEREGVVQVCYSGLWGAICDTFDVPDDYGPDRWHIEQDSTAAVICRQLGYLRPNTCEITCE